MGNDKNVLLVSLWGNYNYGNKLQSYAMKRMIECLGYHVVVSKHDEPKKIFIKYIKAILKTLLRCQSYKEPRSEKREAKFGEFSSLYVANSIQVNNFNTKKIDSNAYYAAVVGSDQVWHNFFGIKRELEYFYLNFMPSKKRIAYAASFGFDEFPLKDQSMHRKGIKGIKNCSCRESSGCRLVESITHLKPPLVLDPTLCLSTSEWDRISVKPTYYTPDNYILVYFIAGLSENNRKFVYNLAEEYNLEIIDIYDATNIYFEMTGPGEFIWLIKHAKYICTDSFHAVAFSILYHKQFLAFPRQNERGKGSYGRIENLFNMTGISGCEYEKCKPFSIPNDAFVRAEKQIQIEKEFSINFLRKALDSVDVDWDR